MLTNFHSRYFYRILFFLLLFSPAIGNDFRMIDLRDYFNNDGISWDEKRLDGDFDAIGQYSPGTFNYAAEELPESNSIITSNGIPFQFPDKSDGQNNNILCNGQLIPISPGNYSVIYILGSSVNGSYDEPFYIQYSDESMDTTRLGLSDWCVEPEFGELPAIRASFRQMKTGDRAPDINHIWLQSVSVDSSKESTAIQLHTSQSHHIFAITLGSGTPVQFTPITKPEKTIDEDKNFSIQIDSVSAGNIFYSGQTARFRVTVANVPETIKKIRFQWKVTDLEDKTILEKEEILTRWEQGGFIYPVRIVGKINGWYQLYVFAKEEEKILLASTTQFAWIPTSPSIDENMPDIFGMGLGFADLSTEEIEKNGQLAEIAGIQWIREEFSWGQIEPLQGKWKWDDYDKSVEAAEKYNLEILGLLDYWTGWSKPYTEEGYSQYAKFVYEVVNRYKDKIKYWEIWNEPNIFYWKGTPEQYAKLLEAAHKAVKEADSEAKIIGCVTAGIDLGFIEKIFQAGGMEHLDGVSVHPYRGHYPDQTGMPEDILALKNLIEKYGGGKEIWITELGWWTNITEKKEGLTYVEQANTMVRSYIVSLASGIDKFFWYTFRDPGLLQDYSEHNFGIVKSDLTPKPAYAALANMTRQLNGYSYMSTIALDSISNAYLFEKENRKLLVAWLNTGSASIGIQSDASALTITDLYGNSMTLLPVDNSITVNLDAIPVYIIGDYTDIKSISRFIDLKSPGLQVQPGQGVDIKIGLHNIFSKDLIGNVAVKISDSIQRKLFFEEEQKEVSLKPGQEEELQFKLNMSDSATVGLTPIEIKVDTNDGGRFRLQTQLKIERKKNNTPPKIEEKQELPDEINK